MNYDPKSTSPELSHAEIEEGVEINITEGSEFLDDAIRTKEQPYDDATEPDDEYEYY